MKIVLGILAVMATFTMHAQQRDAEYAKEGNKVKVTFFHDNGAVAQTGTYTNGKLDGEWVMYDAMGAKQAMGRYANGVRQGKWFFWQQEGLKEVDYLNNQIAQVVKWNSSEAVVINK